MSQAPGRAPRPPVDDTDIRVRNRRMILVGGVMVALAFVVAVGYWYTHQAGKAAPQPTALSITSVDGTLTVGAAHAKHHLVIAESFHCGPCVTFESSVQTFLHADAAAGIVQIKYVIPHGDNSQYDAALASDPTRALALHDRLITEGPTPSGGDLRVILDGKALTASDPVALANALESALAQ